MGLRLAVSFCYIYCMCISVDLLLLPHGGGLMVAHLGQVCYDG